MNELTERKSLTSLFPLFAGTAGFVWQVLFFYIPLFFIIVLSFTGPGVVGYFEPFITLSYVKVIWRSLVLAFFNATVCALIAYPLAYFLAFQVRRFKSFLLFLVILPFWNNFLLHVYAWIFVLDRHGMVNSILKALGLIHEPLHLLNTPFAVGIMMVYFYLPFMIMPLYASLERFDHRLLEASLDLGATWWQTVRRVLLPLTMSGLRSGFFLVFIPSFGEFAIPEFMGGDKTMYVGSVVSHLILGAQTVGAGAAFTVLSSVALIVVAGFLFFLMKRVLRGS
jgi:spermidine/putrescine transport system permease protein